MTTWTVRVVSLVLVAGAVAGPAAAAATPLIHCPRDGRLSQCTGQAFVDIVTTMLKGDPENDIPMVNPLLIPLMPVNKNAGNVLNINMSLTNLKVFDIAQDVVLKSAKFDYDKLELEMDLHRPRVVFRGAYKINGKILWLPIWGRGPVTINMKSVNEKFRLLGEKVREGGKTRWGVKEFSTSLEPAFMSVQYDNLFDGNWLLGKGANTLMNSQWKIIYEQIHPITDAHFSQIMKPHWNRILSHVDLKESFPEPIKAQ